MTNDNIENCEEIPTCIHARIEEAKQQFPGFLNPNDRNHMRSTRILCLLLLMVGLSVSSISAQATPEMTITLNEPFFDAALDAIFENGGLPEIPISQIERRETTTTPSFEQASFAKRDSVVCNEFVKILRENKNVRTAVRFREGKIVAPLA